jgi:hypothetical protein
MPNGLDVVISKNPFGEPQVGDHQIGISFGNDEWGSFFFETLKATFVSIDEGEDSDSYNVRYQAVFEESLKTSLSSLASATIPGRRVCSG